MNALLRYTMLGLIALTFIQLALLPVGVRASGLTITVTFNSLLHDVKPLLCPDDRIYSLAPPNVDPHDYELKPSDISLLRRSDIIVSTAHAPFELKIRELVAKGLIKAKLIEIPYIRGIRILKNPLLNKENLHAITYDPENLKILIKTISSMLSSLRPECRTTYLRKEGEVISEIDKIIREAPKVRINAVGYSPAVQYAVSWIGINITYLLMKEHGIPPSPRDIETIGKLVREGKVSAVILIRLDDVHKLLPGSNMLLEVARKYNLTVIYVPSPLIPSSTIDKLRYIVDELKEIAINKTRSKIAKAPTHLSITSYNYVPLYAVLIGISVLAYMLRRYGSLLNKYVLTLALTLMIYSATSMILWYDIRWLIIFTCAGISYGVLSSLVAARRLYFLASASPHAALLAAVLAIALAAITKINEYVWALIIGVLIIYIAGFMIHKGLDADIATSVLVSSTSALSVISIYYVLTKFRYSADVFSIIVGNPLLSSWEDVIFMAVLALVIVIPMLITYYENVYLGIDREDAGISGAKLWVYDLITFTVLALAAVGLIKVVGFVLEHVLILLPGSIAVLSAKTSRDALITSTIASLFSSIIGLHIASITNIAPSGMTGILLLIIYITLLTMRKRG